MPETAEISFREAIIEAMAARERREIEELAAYLESAPDAARAITEAIDAEDEEFGPDRLQEVFRGGPPGSVREANEAVFGAVMEFAGDAPQFDDITCVTLMRGEDGP